MPTVTGRVGQQRAQTVQSGSLVRVVIDGHVLGYGRTVTKNETYGTEGVYVIGSIMPMEHIPHRWEGTVTVDKFRLRHAPFDDLEGASGITDQKSILPHAQEILLKAVVCLEFMELETDIAKPEDLEVSDIWYDCTLQSNTGNLTANANSGETLSFVARDREVPDANIDHIHNPGFGPGIDPLPVSQGLQPSGGGGAGLSQLTPD